MQCKNAVKQTLYSARTLQKMRPRLALQVGLRWSLGVTARPRRDPHAGEVRFKHGPARLSFTSPGKLRWEAELWSRRHRLEA